LNGSVLEAIVAESGMVQMEDFEDMDQGRAHLSKYLTSDNIEYIKTVY
jgi:hypothetical protein